ncbi:MAG: lipid-A-disaccharide synthase, partial [Bacteroidetes bacterium]
ILVDFPGFNLRMARYARRLGLKVFYFIPPKVWAWNQKRVEVLRKYTDRIFIIFPFEKTFYENRGISVEYFGNPLVDEVEGFRINSGGSGEWRKSVGPDRRPVVALLPGSRRREIRALLPAMVRMAADHTDYQFVVAGAPSLEPSFYEPFLAGSGVGIVFGQTYHLLESAEAGVITSGTATLETALFDVPQVVVYRTGPLAYAIAKRIIKIKFISLVNLVLGHELVREVIQKDIYGSAGPVLAGILVDERTAGEIREGYRELREKLGEKGASGRIAARMVELVKGERE